MLTFGNLATVKARKSKVRALHECLTSSPTFGRYLSKAQIGYVCNVKSAKSQKIVKRKIQIVLSDSGLIRAKGTNARAGLILLDSSLKPVYWNSEALRIVGYPSPPSKAPGAQFLESIRSTVGVKPGSNGSSMTTQFKSGKRRYLCRTFVLERESNRNSKPAIAITLERQRWIVIDLAARFQLTDRQIEAVQHLADGLTSKEIAQRMNISPETVRVILQRIMLRMSVTTRAGVIGRLISGEHLGYESTNPDTV